MLTVSLHLDRTFVRRFESLWTKSFEVEVFHKIVGSLVHYVFTYYYPMLCIDISSKRFQFTRNRHEPSSRPLDGREGISGLAPWMSPHSSRNCTCDHTEQKHECSSVPSRCNKCRLELSPVWLLEVQLYYLVIVQQRLWGDESQTQVAFSSLFPTF